MSEISRDDVVAHFGPVDDATAAEIIATGATVAELQLARTEVAKDELGTADKRLPAGSVGRVIQIVERVRNATCHPITGSLLGEGGSGLA